MSYRVFARKYRPQTFEEVVGQEHITRTLQNAIQQNRLAQAYLFVGPRGIGKTSTARILAKALNCQSGPTTTPCNQCSNCLEISEGNNLDVLEIDGASNNSVDNIRDLRETVAYSPSSGNYKIYLIDEVHMLTTGAFNALLKTLEEPPPHVKFIFATTEAQKVPATITSRCQRFDLRRIPAELIASHLQKIARQEQIELAEEAAAAIARGADGGLRDAESMLDQVVAFCGGAITGKDVLDVFGFTARETVAELANHILQLDTNAALQVLSEQSQAGKDLSRLLEGLISWFRDLLVYQANPRAAVDPESKASFETQKSLVTREKLLDLLDHFAATEGRLKWATDKHLQLDVAVIKAIHLLDQASLTEVIESLSALREGKELPAPAPRPQAAQITPNPAPAEPLQPTVPTQAPTLPPPTPPEPKQPELVNSPSATEPPKETPPASSPAGHDLHLSEHETWMLVVSEMVKASPVRGRLLESSQFISAESGKFHILLPESQRNAINDFVWATVRKNVEAKLTELKGVKTTLVIDFSAAIEPPPPPEPELPEPIQQAPEKPAEPTPAPASQPDTARPMLTEEAFKDDPLIQEALNLFKAQFINNPS